MLTHSDKELDQMIASIKSNCIADNTEELRTLDVSCVQFDDDYYKKKDRAIRQYKHPEKYIPLSFRMAYVAIILSMAALTVTLPLIPMLFILAMSIKREESEINSNAQTFQQHR